MRQVIAFANACRLLVWTATFERIQSVYSMVSCCDAGLLDVTTNSLRRLILTSLYSVTCAGITRVVIFMKCSEVLK
jgi:hypothetical protein